MICICISSFFGVLCQTCHFSCRRRSHMDTTELQLSCLSRSNCLQHELHQGAISCWCWRENLGGFQGWIPEALSRDLPGSGLPRGLEMLRCHDRKSRQVRETEKPQLFWTGRQKTGRILAGWFFCVVLCMKDFEHFTEDLEFFCN